MQVRRPGSSHVTHSLRIRIVYFRFSFLPAIISNNTILCSLTSYPDQPRLSNATNVGCSFLKKLPNLFWINYGCAGFFCLFYRYIFPENVRGSLVALTRHAGKYDTKILIKNATELSNSNRTCQNDLSACRSFSNHFNTKQNVNVSCLYMLKTKTKAFNPKRC